MDVLQFISWVGVAVLLQACSTELEIKRARELQLLAREVKMKLSTALIISLLSSAVVSAIIEPNCTVKYGEFMHASVHVLY